MTTTRKMRLTADHVAELAGEIADPGHLWELQEMVADRIEAAGGE